MGEREMTLGECILWLLHDDGWAVPMQTWQTWVNTTTGETRKDCPIPATIDAAAAALPEGWYQNINHHDISPTKAGGNFESRVFCIATRKRDLFRVDLTADTEILARFRLAVACRQSRGEAGGG